MKLQAENYVVLSEHQQRSLLRAIEAAIEVRHFSQFHAWLRGPFRSLLPHDCVVCVELDGNGLTHHVESIFHGPCSSEKMKIFSDADDGLAVRLIRLVSPTRAGVCVADSLALRSLLASAAGMAEQAFVNPGNALVHRTHFVSGGDCYFVLFGVNSELEEDQKHMLKLLSSHLKMAWSRVIPRPVVIRSAAAVTEREQEILRWMRRGKSNQEISGILVISPITLKNHIRKIYRKLDVQSREEAISRGLGLPLSIANDD